MPGLHARIQQSRRARAWPPNLPTISSRGCAKTMTMKAKTKSEKEMIFQQFFKKTAKKIQLATKNCRRSRFIRKKIVGDYVIPSPKKHARASPEKFDGKKHTVGTNCFVCVNILYILINILWPNG